jgi:hypothetical protein
MGEELEEALIQRREYDILIGLKEAKTALSATFGEPETDGTAKRWSGSRLWGLVRTQVELDGEDGTVIYSTWRTRRFQLLEIGLLIGLLALAISYWGLQNRSDLIWFLEFIFANETNSDVFRFVLLVLAVIVGMTALSRGPSPEFDTGGLEEISRTYSMFYYLYLGLAVVIFGVAFGTVANFPLFVVGVMLTLYGLYVYGSDPAIQSHLGDALPVVPQSGLSKAKPYALVSLCALLLPVVAMTANLLPAILLPTPQSGLAGILARVAVPVGLTIVYCYGCLWALRIIGDAAVEPYTSRLPRVLVFCILLTINVFLIFIFALAVLQVTYAVLPGGVLTDIKYEVGDIAWIVGGLILLSGLGGAAGWFQHKLAAGDGPKTYRLPVLCARMIGLGALFAVFMISSFVFANLVGLVMFGDAAILDPSPETIRLQTEQFLFVNSALNVEVGA